MHPASHPGDRDPFIDLLRVGSVLIVVLGHWAAAVVIWEPGRIVAGNALSHISGLHPATWVLQVMPLLFFAGGFANARVLDRFGGRVLPYLRLRYRRLLTPTIGFVLVWLTIGVVAELLALPEVNPIERAADVAALPLWFLGLYVVVVALAPWMRRLHRRFGVGVPVVLAIGAVLVDVLVYAAGIEAVGVANYAFVWLLPHQLGFFYADSRGGDFEPRAFALVAASGLLSLVGLVAFAGYPVSMVGVPGDPRWNTDPPSVALVALTVFLIGAAMTVQPRLRRTSAVVERLGPVVLTLYLWHVSALSLAVMVLYPFGFPRPEVGSLDWWLLRPLWVAAIAPFLVLLVVVARPLEIHPPPDWSLPASDLRRRLAAAVFGVVATAQGIIGFGVSGFDRPTASPVETVLGFGVGPIVNTIHLGIGLALLATATTRRRRPGPVMTVAGMLYLTLGVLGWSSAFGGMTTSTARLDLVVGATGIAGTMVASMVDRRQGAVQVRRRTRR